MFLTIDRERRRLSDYLAKEVARPLLNEIARWDDDKALGSETEELVRALVESIDMRPPPRLHGADLGNDQDQGDRRPVATESGEFVGATVATVRKWVAVEVDGWIDLLEYWPDAVESVSPIDEGRPAYGDLPEVEGQSEFDVELQLHEQRLRQQQWQIMFRTKQGPRALFTFIDMTESEEEEVLRGERDPRAELEAERKRIEPIVEAIGVQTQNYYSSELPTVLADAIEQRKLRARARNAVRENLVFPNSWRVPPPELLEPGRQSPTEVSDAATSPASTELEIAHTPRLAPASFDDVQRVVRVWADSVERHPIAYHDLEEDRLSDLLVATLNATLPGASREVYSRGGKSDIFVRADVLSEGSGPAKIFICESKWWDGPSKACDALDQLLGYLEVKDTAAILLFFVGRRDPSSIRAGALEAFSRRDDYVGTTQSSVAGWPISIHASDGRNVEVCVAFVDLPQG